MQDFFFRTAKWLGLLGVFAAVIGVLSHRLVESWDQAKGVRVDEQRQVLLRPLSPELEQVVTRLNADFARSWAAAGVNPAPRADWYTVCRRLSLALVGTGMSLEEIRQLQGAAEDDRVRLHRENLLADERFAHYWAERLARTFVGTDQGPFLAYRRRKFTQWLAEQIAANRPYNQVVRQLITARGYFTDRPEVNFITVTMDSGAEGQPDPVRLAGRSARTFLGVRLDCVQCHDDFLGTLELGEDPHPRGATQADFHRLAAFYSESRFHPLQGIRAQKHPYRAEYLGDTSPREIEPGVPFAPELLPSTGTAAERLAGWVTDDRNKQAARALANRVWGLMTGRPLHQPVDSIPVFGPLPCGLETLAGGVVELRWDLRQIIRAITETEVFQLDSRAEFEIQPDHEELWGVYPLSRLRPEQVARSLAQASRLTTINESAAFLMQLIALGVENDFVERFGDTGEDEFEQENLTVTQRLLLMNGTLVRERTENNPILNATSHLRILGRSDAEIIDSVYLAVLNRLPRATERSYFFKQLREAANRQEAIEDLYWILLNSSEWGWNH